MFACRDGSACTTLKKVPGPSGQLVDKWETFYLRQETEKEFYLRNKQVTKADLKTCSKNYPLPRLNRHKAGW